jgi:phage/plasmid primase-like uncharacterized protein
MGEFIRDRLPDPILYFADGEGFKLAGPGKWKTTRCIFHGGSDSMRINTSSGAWVCMSCGEKGGDVLAFHMKVHGLDFIEAAKDLNAWDDNGTPSAPHRPRALSASAAIQVLSFEANLAAVAAGNVARGIQLSERDRQRLMTAVGRINRITEDFQ